MIEQHRFHEMRDRRIRLAECAPMEAVFYAPRFFGWRGALVSVVIIAGLFGLLAVGAA